MSSVNIVQIGVKYCGGCNPVIDRTGLVREIAKLLPSGYRMTTDGCPVPGDITILICGCCVACADKPEIRNSVRRLVIVAGSSVDLEAVPEEKIAATVVRKIVNPK